MRFRLITHIFFSVFAFRPHLYDRNKGLYLLKGRFSKTLSRVEVFENGGLASSVDARKRFRNLRSKNNQVVWISGIR